MEPKPCKCIIAFISKKTCKQANAFVRISLQIQISTGDKRDQLTCRWMSINLFIATKAGLPGDLKNLKPKMGFPAGRPAKGRSASTIG